MTAPTPTTPAADYRIELEAYAGPLDLLLYLVKRHEIDLHDIPVAKLTDQYLQHLERIKRIDIDRAGEFLVMAATLLEIKSLMIVPHSPEDEEEAARIESEDLPDTDPRYELVQQLLAYKRFKDAAVQLEKQHDRWQSRFEVHAKRSDAKPKPEPKEGEAEAAEIDLEDANIMDLHAAFSRILESIGHRGDHEVTYDDTPISMHADDIFDRLQTDSTTGRMTLQSIFIGRQNRSELIGLFLATLELVRQKKVAVVQPADGGEIMLEIRKDDEQLNPADDTATDWRDPETGEMQYDYPDEESRRRVERRAKLRATIAAKRAEGAQVDADELEELEGESPEAAAADMDADIQVDIDVEIKERKPAGDVEPGEDIDETGTA